MKKSINTLITALIFILMVYVRHSYAESELPDSLQSTEAAAIEPESTAVTQPIDESLNPSVESTESVVELASIINIAVSDWLTISETTLVNNQQQLFIRGSIDRNQIENSINQAFRSPFAITSDQLTKLTINQINIPQSEIDSVGNFETTLSFEDIPNQQLTFNLAGFSMIDGQTTYNISFQTINRDISDVFNVIALNQVDVVSSASTTMTIQDWIVVEEPITVDTTSITATFNLNDLYTKIFTTLGWANSITSRDMIKEALLKLELELWVDDVVVSRKGFPTANGSLYNFKFDALDLTKAKAVTLKLPDLVVAGFGPTPKLSTFIFEPIDLTLLSSPLEFGVVENVTFEAQEFSYALNSKSIQQADPFTIEIKGADNQQWTLLATTSSQLIGGTTEVDSQLYYGDLLLSNSGQIIRNFENTPDPLNIVFIDDFSLKIPNPNQLDIVGTETFTTTITWTLQNAHN